jgi:hypothetical protein
VEVLGPTPIPKVGSCFKSTSIAPALKAWPTPHKGAEIAKAQSFDWAFVNQKPLRIRVKPLQAARAKASRL